MNLIFAHEPFPIAGTSSVFLAGPTPRAKSGEAPKPSWRQDALILFEKKGYKGDICIPEPREGWKDDYDGQVDWEIEGRKRSDIILFYVPRELQTLPAFTTNVEFGEDLTTGKALYGRPDDAPKNKYLDSLWKRSGHEHPDTTLEALVDRTLDIIGHGAQREGPARWVPLWIWEHKPFQDWLTHQTAHGFEIDRFEVQTTLRNGPGPRNVTGWVANVRQSWREHGGVLKTQNGVLFCQGDEVFAHKLLQD